MNKRRNLLNISDLTVDDVENITKLANQYLKKEVANSHILENKTVINLFFEDSTRTLASFEIAAKSLGANVVTLPIRSSSINKGEDLKDMIKTLNAMNPDYIIIRHKSSGIINTLAKYVNCLLINAGDGSSEHPTQALADYLVISNHKKQIKDLKVVICGDILHSRVARSNIRLLKMFGAEINLVAPPTLICKHFPEVDSVHYSLIEGIKDADVIMLLRLQKERMNNSSSEKEYFYLYGLDSQKLSYAKPDAIVMHPGPINRGIEISSDVADCVILQQVEFGLAIRKAVLHYYRPC
ncbi:aspartate carbamoyltransferase catalytic subunit [Wolbachia endosymbiont of Drosophila bocki]|uniref:aspartate carbamoyltransferase catalytic subunit n=1 Tax=unclassified Wolbachia TaxID=2640676 RepID=UPI0023A9326C|nr:MULTISPECIES: aspartate carbamoyltransferase catalytic subunit [unclassified Wolbachia]MDE5058214.1 aspartate carbamoyltransferase catalytic subunit [Wolbachia endosymbiont of Drosophila bocki]MDE5067497.1 aspartate carbamoyltransferase catalytic subunit [Wolbachia endosymbiont of Drosophila leontia]